MTKRSLRFRVAAAGSSLPLLLALGACTAAPPVEVATDTNAVTHEANERVPEGAAWTQHYFPSSDGSDVELHADVLLPENLPEGEQVPVILSVSSYFSHAGEISDEGHKNAGPSGRFADLVEGIDLFNEGYALVLVDLRGFGGSSGCLDFTGPGEQADVDAAIDWAASQPWSTGAVGMYGKSYDALTGLVGNNLNNDALKAVIAQSPMWDPYHAMRSNGVPRSPIVDSSRSYNEGAKLGALPDDDERYQANAEYDQDAFICEVTNTDGYKTADQNSDYWTSRDVAARAVGTDTPLFFTQGLLDIVTPPEGIEEFLANHEGPQRGWIGQWNHIRGNDTTDDGVIEVGREGWFDETLAFYDQYLKGIEPTEEYPNFAVQDSSGTWRAQDTWPVVENEATIALGNGTYLDDGAEGDPTVDTGNGFVQFSEPIAEDTRITGTPNIALNASTNGNVMVKLHDVAPDGSAVLIDEQVAALNPGAAAFDLKSTDWTLAAGHVLAVEIGTVRTGATSNWIDTPSYQSIDVSGIALTLALDDPADDAGLEGDSAVYMESYLGFASSELPIGVASFTLPSPRG